MHPLNYISLRLNYTSTLLNSAISVIISATHYSVVYSKLCYCSPCFLSNLQVLYLPSGNKNVQNERFTNFVELRFHRVASSWHNLHYKASASILFPYISSKFCRVTLFFFFFSIFTTHAHLFLSCLTLYNLTNMSCVSLQEDLGKLQQWEKTWGMSFNPTNIIHV